MQANGALPRPGPWKNKRRRQKEKNVKSKKGRKEEKRGDAGLQDEKKKWPKFSPVPKLLSLFATGFGGMEILAHSGGIPYCNWSAK